MAFQYLKACNSVCVCEGPYEEGTDAPLRRLPLEAAVDVAASVNEEHEAAPHSVKVLQ